MGISYPAVKLKGGKDSSILLLFDLQIGKCWLWKKYFFTKKELKESMDDSCKKSSKKAQYFRNYGHFLGAFAFPHCTFSGQLECNIRHDIFSYALGNWQFNPKIFHESLKQFWRKWMCLSGLFQAVPMAFMGHIIFLRHIEHKPRLICSIQVRYKDFCPSMARKRNRPI